MQISGSGLFYPSRTSVRIYFDFRFYLDVCVCFSLYLSSVPLIQFSFRYRGIRCPLFRWVASHELPMWCQSIKFIKKKRITNKRRRREHALIHCYASNHIYLYMCWRVCVSVCMNTHAYSYIYIEQVQVDSDCQWQWLLMLPLILAFGPNRHHLPKHYQHQNNRMSTNIYNDNKITIEL